MLAMRSLVVALLVTSCTAESDFNEEKEINGNSFMWGTATSAYQSEGFTTAGNRGPSVWDTFIHLSGQQRIENNATAEHGNRDYEQYESKTVPLLQDLGVQYYRLSISWTRILSKQTEENPKGEVNQEGIDHYKSVFASLKKSWH